MGQSLDELSRPGRELLRLLWNHVQVQAAALQTTPDKITFSRREIRESFLAGLKSVEQLRQEAGRIGLAPNNGVQAAPNNGVQASPAGPARSLRGWRQPT